MDKDIQKLGPVTLVEGTDADLEAFFALEQKYASPNYRAETKREDIYGDNKFFYMIKTGGNIVGDIAYEKQEGNVIYLNVLAIEPHLQGKGLGREAMRQFLEKVSDASKVWLVTHPENKAVNLYKSLGFKITEQKENYFGTGTPRVVMVLEKKN